MYEAIVIISAWLDNYILPSLCSYKHQEINIYIYLYIFVFINYEICIYIFYYERKQNEINNEIIE